MEEIRKQWEVREAQLTKEFEVGYLIFGWQAPVVDSDKASRAEQHKQFEDYMRNNREAAGHANPEAVQKILEDAHKRYEQELVQREEEFSRKKEEEVS
jgi:hypothetical protein